MQVAGWHGATQDPKLPAHAELCSTSPRSRQLEVDLLRRIGILDTPPERQQRASSPLMPEPLLQTSFHEGADPQAPASEHVGGEIASLFARPASQRVRDIQRRLTSPDMHSPAVSSTSPPEGGRTSKRRTVPVPVIEQPLLDGLQHVSLTRSEAVGLPIEAKRVTNATDAELSAELQACQRALAQSRAEHTSVERQAEELREEHEAQLVALSTLLDELDAEVVAESAKRNQEEEVSRRALEDLKIELAEAHMQVLVLQAQEELMHSEASVSPAQLEDLRGNLSALQRDEEATESDVMALRLAASGLQEDLKLQDIEREKRQSRSRLLNEELQQAEHQIDMYQDWSRAVHEELQEVSAELRVDRGTRHNWAALKEPQHNLSTLSTRDEWQNSSFVSPRHRSYSISSLPTGLPPPYSSPKSLPCATTSVRNRTPAAAADAPLLVRKVPSSPCAVIAGGAPMLR
mmetsp:Transcript_48543/g.113652  ORF Transcript_48543/g.113652 Transcript_48543/m.113652 type:complete len:461 (+) Transcript_48543:57-1439(+)